MLIAIQMPHEPGSSYPPALPPPLLPKPAKDNLRLQKLLKKTAKKTTVTTLQSSSFRTSLSPVSEASHDQDAMPQPCPKTPGTTAPPAPLSTPRILGPTAHSPYKPVIQHVPSPLKKKSFSFSVTQQRSLAEHFRMTTPQFGVLGPPSSSAPTPAPREESYSSWVHLHVGPLLSPPSLAPVAPLTAGGWGEGEQEPASTEAQDQGVATPKPSAVAQIPGALSANAQATRPCPKLSATRLSASVEPKQLITKIVVPIAPPYRSPGLPPHSPLPRSLSTKAEPPPVPPKPSTVHMKVAAASEPEQQPTELPRDTLDPLGGEVPEATPTPMPRTHFSGWTRLRKQLIVAPEAPPFPEPEGASREPVVSPSVPQPLGSRATKMWDAVLYHMTVAKSGNQSKNTQEGAKAPPGGLLGHGSFLPFLYRPRFDARKLREAAAHPPAKVNSALGTSLRSSLAPKNFNRTAACWQLK